MHSLCTETSGFVPHVRHVFNLMVYVVVDVFTAVKSARDRGIVGPGIVPSMQAGLKEDIMLGSLVRGVGCLMATSIPTEEKVGRRWRHEGFGL